MTTISISKQHQEHLVDYSNKSSGTRSSAHAPRAINHLLCNTAWSPSLGEGEQHRLSTPGRDEADARDSEGRPDPSPSGAGTGEEEAGYG